MSCKRFCLSVALVVVTGLGALYVRHGSVENVLYQYFPMIPTKYFQDFSVYYLYLATCLFKSALPSPCRKDQNELWVTVATAKGGTVIAARTSLVFGDTCGLCTGIGHRPDGLWPPAREEVPWYKCDVLLALANMQDWPSYAEKHGGRVRCVVLTRNPAARFKSLYQYVYDGSEYDLYEPSRQLREWHANSIPDAVDRLFRTIGNKTMYDAHQHISKSLVRKECKQIRFEEFDTDFDGAIRIWAAQWGVDDPAMQAKLVENASVHNLKRKSKDEMAMEHHQSGKSFTKQEKAELDAAMWAHPELSRMIQIHAKELGY